MKKFIALLLFLPVLAAGQVKLAVAPAEPAPGEPAVISVVAGEAAEIVAASPMGLWFQRQKAEAGKRMPVELPADLPVLLIGYRQKSESRYQFKIVPLKGREYSDKTNLWMAYFSAGQPAIGNVTLPETTEISNPQEALAAAVAGVETGGQNRWNSIIQIQSAQRRIEAMLTWLEENPTTQFRAQLFQFLAGSFAELEDHLRTIAYGRMALDLMPGDAMTLNGVAYAMAQAEVDLNQALLFSDRALTILSASDQLQKPQHLTSAQWRQEILNAQAATMDTKGWILTKLERYGEARQNFEAALSRARRDEIYLHYGLMLKMAGELQEMRSVLEKGLALNGPHQNEIKAVLEEQE